MIKLFCDYCKKETDDLPRTTGEVVSLDDNQFPVEVMFVVRVSAPEEAHPAICVPCSDRAITVAIEQKSVNRQQLVK